MWSVIQERLPARAPCGLRPSLRVDVLTIGCAGRVEHLGCDRQLSRHSCTTLVLQCEHVGQAGTSCLAGPVSTELSFLLGSTRAGVHPTAMRDSCGVQGGDSRTHPEKWSQAGKWFDGSPCLYIGETWFVGMVDDGAENAMATSSEQREIASENAVTAWSKWRP